MAKKNNENTTTIVAMEVAAAVQLVHAKPTAQEVANIRASNPAFACAVDAVAAKFGAADKSARNRPSFPDITDEEWKLLPYAERTYKDALWPYIAGHGTHPMTSLLQREEADKYYQQQKEHEGMGTPTGPRSKVSIEDEVASIGKVKSFIADIKAMEEAGLNEVALRMLAYTPTLNAPVFTSIFNGSSVDVLKGKKVSLAYLLCRKGEERPDSMVSMAEAMGQGFFPMVSKAELDAKLEKFKAAGLDCTDFIELV